MTQFQLDAPRSVGMMRRLMKRTIGPVVVMLAVLLSSGCPKKVTPAASGTDDEQMDQYSAQLEEYAARSRASEPTCAEWSSMAKPVCELSSRICAISSKVAERAEFQRKCVTSQEECARFNEHATGCAQ